jgi:hypothetical protein
MLFMKQQAPCRNLFSSSRKSCVSDFGYSFPLLSEYPTLLPAAPRTVYNPRRYVPPFAAHHHIRIRPICEDM